MEKGRLTSLTKHLNNLQNKLSDVQQGVLPEKHKNRPKEYTQFLEREIEAVKKTLTADKL